MECPNCGGRIKNRDQFCPGCGTGLKLVAVQNKSLGERIENLMNWIMENLFTAILVIIILGAIANYAKEFLKDLFK